MGIGAFIVSLTVKISKITKEKHVLHFRLFHPQHVKTQVNRVKQSRNPREIPGRGGEEKSCCAPPHLISWRRHCLQPLASSFLLLPFPVLLFIIYSVLGGFIPIFVPVCLLSLSYRSSVYSFYLFHNPPYPLTDFPWHFLSLRTFPTSILCQLLHLVFSFLRRCLRFSGASLAYL